MATEVRETPALGIFWDIENCPVPSGKSSAKVCEKIRSMNFYKDHLETLFLVVCDVNRMNDEVIDELNASQVDVQHVSVKKKNAADEKLRQAMRRFVDTYSVSGHPTPRVVLISGDVDFLSDLSDFKRRKHISIILLHTKNTSEQLILASCEHMEFHKMLEDIPRKLVGPFRFTELEVSNLPSIPSEMSYEEVKRQLSALVLSCHGKVCAINVDGTAMVRFDTADRTERAKVRMQSAAIGPRKITVDFNRRGSFIRRTHSQSPFHEVDNDNKGRSNGFGSYYVKPYESDGGNQSRPTRQNFNVSRRRSQSRSQDRSSASKLRFPDEVGRRKRKDFKPKKMTIQKAVSDGSRDVRCLEYSSSTAGSDDEASPDLLPPPRPSMLNDLRNERFHRKSYSESDDMDQEGGAKHKRKNMLAADFGRLNISRSDENGVRRTNRTTRVEVIISGFGHFDQVDRELDMIAEEMALELKMGQQMVENIKMFVDTRTHELKCRVEVPDLISAQKMIKLLESCRYQGHPLTAAYANPSDEDRARVVSLVIENERLLNWGEFCDLFTSAYGQGISLIRVRQIPDVVVENDVIRLSDELYPTPKAPSTRRTARIVHHTNSPAAPVASQRADLCAWHDERKLSEMHFISPIVKSSVANVRQLLEEALASHKGAIPLESLLRCLNSCAKTKSQVIQVVPPSKGGVRLEQLLELIGLTEVVSERIRPGPFGDGAFKVVRKTRKTMNGAGKSPQILKLQKELTDLLLSSPNYRLNLTNDLVEEYYRCHGRRLELTDSHLAAMADTVHVMGANRMRELALTPDFLRRLFHRCLRSILTREADGKIEKEELPKVYKELYEKDFLVTDYGFCNLEDLLDYCFSNQTVFRLDGHSTISVGNEIKTFIDNAVVIIIQKSDMACTIGRFDDSYLSRFGSYCIPDMGFTDIVELFSEFSSRLAVIEHGSQTLLTVAECIKVEVLGGHIVRILQTMPENVLDVGMIVGVYSSVYKVDLLRIIGMMPGIQSVIDVIRKHGDPLVMIKSLVTLKGGAFLAKFEEQVISLVSGLGAVVPITDLQIAFKERYGSEAVYDEVYVRKEMALAKGLLDLKFKMGEEVVAVSENYQALHRATRDQSFLTIKEASEKCGMAGDELEEVFRQFPGHVQVHARNGETHVTVSKKCVELQSKSETKDVVKKRRSRIAAVFTNPVMD